MNAEKQIKEYITSLPQQKQTEIQELHKCIVKALPKCKLWFYDGKDDKGKVVANPTIGYGFQTIKYSNGTTRDFFQVGMGSSSTGIFVHILPVKDKTFLAKTYGKELGKASVAGYAIKFKTLKDINIDVLLAAIKYGTEASE